MNLGILSEREGEPVSPAIGTLLENIYEALKKKAPPSEVCNAVSPLLGYLCSNEGRTNANCWAVDTFFSLQEGWTCDWLYLPKEVQEIFCDMGGTLHDTFHEPKIAENFYSTPEQLLARLRDYEENRTNA